MSLKKVVLGDVSQSSQPTFSSQLNSKLNTYVFLGEKEQHLYMGHMDKELETDLLVRGPGPFTPYSPHKALRVTHKFQDFSRINRATRTSGISLGSCSGSLELGFIPGLCPFSSFLSFIKILVFSLLQIPKTFT